MRTQLALAGGWATELELDALRRLIDRSETLDDLALAIGRGLPFIASLNAARQREINLLIDAHAASITEDFGDADRLDLLCEIMARAEAIGLGAQIRETAPGRYGIVIEPARRRA